MVTKAIAQSSVGRRRSNDADGLGDDDDPWGERAYYETLKARPIEPVKDHLEALATSSRLTTLFRKERQPHVLKVTPERIIATLSRANIRFVFMGTHAINIYRYEARATQDVDLLVSWKYHAAAVIALRKVFPKLAVEDRPLVVRFIDSVTGKSVIDLLKPKLPLFKEVFRQAIPVDGMQRIPSLETALAAKYAAMKSPDRCLSKRYLDAGDFYSAVERSRRILDLVNLKKLGALVQPNGGPMILRAVKDIDAERLIQI